MAPSPLQELWLQTGVPVAASDDVLNGWRLMTWVDEDTGSGLPSRCSLVSSTIRVRVERYLLLSDLTPLSRIPL